MKSQYGTKTDQALSLWVKLSRAAATFGKKASDQIQTTGLTQSQFGVIETLGHLGGMTMCEISRKMLVSGGNMTVVVDNLEKQGLVERVRSKEDRRAIRISLTPAGKQVFERIFPEHAAYVTRLASALSSKEQQTLAALLKKLGLAVAGME